MAIQFRCPQGHLLSIHEQYAGKKLRCPRCLRIATIPAASASESGRTTPATKAAGESSSAAVKSTAGGPHQSTPASLTSAPVPPPIAAMLDPSPPPPLPTVSAPPIVPPPLAPQISGASGRAFEGSEFAGLEDNAEVPLDFATTPSHVRKSQPPAVQGYRADKPRAKKVRQLGAGLVVLSLVHLAPAAGHLAITSAPDWARAVILVALLELAFAVWMVLVPDWSTVWATMIVLALVATLYGAALAVAILTPPGTPAVLEMDDIRQSARLWCSVVIVLTCALTYLCGRFSFKWYKQFQLGK